VFVSLVLRVTEHHLGAGQLRSAAREVLAAAFAEVPYDRAPGDVEDMLARFDRHASKPGFRLVLAVDDGRPVALAYGYRLPANTGWWKDTLEPVPDEVAHEDGSRSFAVFELAVVPDRRRERLGTRVHEKLLEDRSEQRVVLNVRQDAEPARAAYAKWGYRRAASVIPWADAPVYDVMVLDLA
jgi:ribosomal protein S18 acetylase RimI-like enzyme